MEEELRKFAKEAVDALIWCSGSPSFAPEGEAREGWEKGPEKVIAKGFLLLNREYRDDAPSAPLGS